MGVQEGRSSSSQYLPLWQRGTKGDFKSLSISPCSSQGQALYKREKPGLGEFEERDSP